MLELTRYTRKGCPKQMTSQLVRRCGSSGVRRSGSSRACFRPSGVARFFCSVRLVVVRFDPADGIAKQFFAVSQMQLLFDVRAMGINRPRRNA